MTVTVAISCPDNTSLHNEYLVGVRYCECHSVERHRGMMMMLLHKYSALLEIWLPNNIRLIVITSGLQMQQSGFLQWWVTELCSWARQLTCLLTVPLSSQSYKWVPENCQDKLQKMLGLPATNWHHMQGSNLNPRLVTWFFETKVKPQPIQLPGL